MNIASITATTAATMNRDDFSWEAFVNHNWYGIWSGLGKQAAIVVCESPTGGVVPLRIYMGNALTTDPQLSPPYAKATDPSLGKHQYGPTTAQRQYLILALPQAITIAKANTLDGQNDETSDVWLYVKGTAPKWKALN